MNIFSSFHWSIARADISAREYRAMGAVILASFVAWGTIWLAFTYVSDKFWFWLFAILMLSLWSAFAGLGFILFRPMFTEYLSYAVSSLVPLIFFGLNGWTLFGACVLFLFSALAFRAVAREKDELVFFQFLRIMRHGMPLFFSGVAFMLALGYNFSPIGAWMSHPQIPRAAVEASFVLIDGILAPMVPGYHKEITLGELQQIVAQSIIFAVLPQELRNQPATKELPNFRVIGDNAILKQTLPEFFYRQINDSFNSIAGSAREFLPIFFVFGLFLIFKVLSAPFMWFVLAVEWGAMKMLLYARIIEIRREMMPHEKLALR